MTTLAVCRPRLLIQPVRSQLVFCGHLLHPQPKEGPRRGTKQPNRVVVVVVVVVAVVVVVVVVDVVIVVVAGAVAVVTVVIIIITIIIIIIIIIIITFMQCIYTYIPEINPVYCVYYVVVILHLRFMVHGTYFVF